MRAYIDAEEPNEDEFTITVWSNKVLVGRVDISKPVIWLYTTENEDGDLVINCSQGMEPYKWDHLTKEIINEQPAGHKPRTRKSKRTNN